VHPIEIQAGFIDTAGGAGPNDALDSFSAIPAELRRPHADDFLDEPGYLFWMVTVQV
jgi:hypothetical protein